MNSPQLCSISQLDAGIGRRKWTHAYDIRREQSMDMNSDLHDFQTRGESQEVIPDHHCPLPTPAPDWLQIYQFMLLIQPVAQNHGKVQGTM